jgi:diacylglycerol kinase family enzyme
MPRHDERSGLERRYVPPMLALVVGNPSAQSGQAARFIARAVESLALRGLSCRVVHTEPAGRTPDLVAAAIAAHSPDVVCSLGGDGTFNEVARGILASGRALPMGLFPLGTANDQGKSFGIASGPAHLEEQAAIVAAGFVRRIDAGRIRALEGGRELARSVFFDSASFGLAPDVLAARNRDRRELARVPLLSMLYRDQAVYVGAALERMLASLVEPMKVDAVIETDRFELTRTALTDVVVKATPIFAGEWVLERRAEPDDGLFELITVAGRREWLERIVGDLAANPFRPEAVGMPRPEHRAASRFSLSFYRPGREGVASQIDGEEWVEADRFEIEVAPRALSLVVPESFVPPWR